MNYCCKPSVQKLHLEFNNPEQTCSRFSLGECFAHHKVHLEITAVREGFPDQTREVDFSTDSKGEFGLKIPSYTVGVYLKVNLKQKCDRCCPTLTFSEEFHPYQPTDVITRTLDGSSNNLEHPNWGMANTALKRRSVPDYGPTSVSQTGSQGSAERTAGDSGLAVRGPLNPSPRAVSNAICRQSQSDPSNLNNLTWLFGQFVDHEIDLTEGQHGAEVERADVVTSAQDPYEEYPGRTIPFTRSAFLPNTEPREQPNQISSFLDGTNVYGYNSQRGMALRTLDGTGMLRTSLSQNGEVLPMLNTQKYPNAEHGPTPSEDFFLVGDIRGNENVLLTGIHTLFLREHNRQCERILENKPDWAGQDQLVYEHAKRMINGMIQSILFTEFLPSLVQPEAIPPYVGYNSQVDPSVVTEFSTVGYRFGHTMLTSVLQVGTGSTATSIRLRNAFFNPEYVRRNGVDALLRGAMEQRMEQIDGKIVDDVRNFLFDAPTTAHLLDLATLNIQRGRDHGIPAYNVVRQAYGLEPKQSFAEITDDLQVQTELERLYESVEWIDPWIGCLVERHLPGAQVGELIQTILIDQFTRLRDGDRMWFEVDQALSEEEKRDIRSTTLVDLIQRNTQG